MSASSSSPRPASSVRCVHFGTCGGCALQHLPYEEQLRLKTEKVRAALSSIKDIPEPVPHASPDIWYYRNKMEFSFGDVYPPQEGGPTVKLGMKPKGRWYEILDLRECFLLSPETAPLLERVRAWAEAEKVPPYNGHKKSGCLRHLVLREGKNTGERLVYLVTAPGGFPEESFLAAVREAYPAAAVLHGVNEKASDVAVSAEPRTLFGPGHITETLRFGDRELRLRISPHSFFQTNTGAANLLYGRLRDWVKEEDADTVLDLYCGGGGITLSIADCCRKAVGVESHPAAVADARANARFNGLRNAEFYHSATEFLLPALLAMAPQAAVCDPPRAGLHAAARAVLAAQGPRTLIYVSCNPQSLARDLEALGPAYRLERLEVFDLFPHTEHVETVALLRRNKL
ncbi:MAG: 23S rRNA (uracil(1939)-C(5))-methyltransferase RlmD [Elusimicrobia bacterium]|nr:23S rRNA (uracil(1939)-C(5))-methyltransferase RlmD [Elusimicrobiota bacterium]